MSTVVDQPYSTAGNGGRKLVRLSNGWEVAVTKATDNFHFYADRKDGNGFKFLHTITSVDIDNNDIAMAALGNIVHIIFGQGVSNVTNRSIEVTQSGSAISSSKFIAAGQSALGNVSLAINPQGTELHAGWASRNSSYPNSFNIRYAKATISDGSVTWGAVEQVTTSNQTGIDNTEPTISVQGGAPIIICKSDTVATGTRDRIRSYRKNGTSWASTEIYDGGTYAQSSPSAVVDKDGVIHVAWSGADATDTNRNNIRYSKSIDGGLTWSPMQKLTNGNSLQQNYPSITVDRNGDPRILYSGDGTSGVAYSIKQLKSLDGTGWESSFVVQRTGDNANNATFPSTLYDPTFAGAFGDTPPTIYQADGMVRYTGTYNTNQAPTITMNTPNNQTLYENDTFLIDGTAKDTDAGDIVNVRYQINAGTARAIATAISDGATLIPFNRQLTFKGGILYDGQTAITSALAEGVAHTLKVWAEDDKGGKSVEQSRTFYVVPNRPPTLSIDALDSRDGLINADIIGISGTASDPDGNDVTVKYRINSGLNTQIYSGPSGAWSFDIPLSKLADGVNTIVVEVTDIYDFKFSRTVKLNKHANLTPLTTSTQRYKITPPSGSAKGVLMWIQRDATLTVAADISMTNGTEPESYVPMTLENTAPVAGITVEDEFIFHMDVSAEHISVKLTLTGDGAITIISGVLSQ